MKKSLLPGLLLLSLSGTLASAQTISSGDTAGSQPRLSLTSPTPGADDSADDKKPAAKAEQTPSGPTTIDSKTMDYDEKTRMAVFTGENYGVFVKDPSFTIYSDKLTAYMRKGGAPAGQKGMPSSEANPKGSTSGTASKGGGLQRAVAEGPPEHPVVIVQDKPASSGEEAQHNVGIAEKADYNADTGDVVLTGWPRVSQGINTQIATSRDTVMVMNKDGHTMKTHGPSHSVIQEQNQAKKSPTPSSE